MSDLAELSLALRAAEQQGRRSATLYGVSPSPLPDADFGAFAAHTGFAALLVRRALAALDVPPRWLVGVRSLFQRSGPRSKFEQFLRRYAYWRGVKRALGRSEVWRRIQRGPIILMYHAVSRTAEQGSHYVVPHVRFRRQMQWLKRRRYHVLRLEELLTHLAAGTLPPARSVVITFDDGFADNCEVALPILREQDLTATVFVVSDTIGGSANWTAEPALAGRAMMSAVQLRAMANEGIEIGAHTRTHPSLIVASGERQASELRGSREALERLLERPVRTFAYPFGDYDASVSANVAAAGFTGACCSRSGVNDPATSPFELRRIEIRGTDSLAAFALMLWRGRRPRRRRQPSRGLRLVTS